MTLAIVRRCECGRRITARGRPKCSLCLTNVGTPFVPQPPVELTALVARLRDCADRAGHLLTGANRQFAQGTRDLDWAIEAIERDLAYLAEAVMVQQLEARHPVKRTA